MNTILSSLFCFVLWIPFAQAGDSFALPSCSPLSSPGTLCSCELSSLHPTQISVGMIEVRDKKNELSQLENDELDHYLKKHPEPTVIGPKGLYFVTDHHHLGRALLEMQVSTTYCQIIENGSALDSQTFWELMTRNNWVYPFDENGKGPLPVSNLPAQLSQLKDDPYRSLAGAVRRHGGYEKTTAPFAEFAWANFFRTRISSDQIRHDFDAAVEIGIDLAHSPDAAGLPGYQGDL